MRSKLQLLELCDVLIKLTAKDRAGVGRGYANTGEVNTGSRIGAEILYA